jgi:hypothetical protein
MKEFYLQLFDPAKGRSLTLVPIIGLVGLFAIAFGGIGSGVIASPLLAGIYLIVVLGGGGFWGYRAYKKWALVASTVIISEDAIVVTEGTYELLHVPFIAIASYRYQSVNDLEELRITLENGEKLKIRSNSKLTKIGNFAGMVDAFESQLTQQQATGALATIRREKSFFEKSISTWLLVAMSILLAWLTLDLMTSAHVKRPASLFMVYGNYLIYLGAWLAASARRKAVS